MNGFLSFLLTLEYFSVYLSVVMCDRLYDIGFGVLRYVHTNKKIINMNF